MKGSPPEDLLRAIRTVTAGKPFVDPSLSPSLIMSTVGADAPLSEREREILQLLAEGLHTEDVAKRIGLSTETVKSDTKRAILKLEADSRVHAVAIALRQAMIGKRRALSELPRRIVVQILIVVFVLIGAVIAITKLV